MLSVCNSLRRHWGYRTLGKRTYSLEEFVPVRVDCRLPRNAKFDYAAVSLRAGNDAFAGVTEVWSIRADGGRSWVEED